MPLKWILRQCLFLLELSYRRNPSTGDAQRNSRRPGSMTSFKHAYICLYSFHSNQSSARHLGLLQSQQGNKFYNWCKLATVFFPVLPPLWWSLVYKPGTMMTIKPSPQIVLWIRAHYYEFWTCKFQELELPAGEKTVLVPDQQAPPGRRELAFQPGHIFALSAFSPNGPPAVGWISSLSGPQVSPSVLVHTVQWPAKSWGSRRWWGNKWLMVGK